MFVGLFAGYAGSEDRGSVYEDTAILCACDSAVGE
jgi:hypothetical protein